MTKVIAIAHEKGGVGKTTTAINLGIGLARQGKNVLLLDADPQGDLTKCLGVKDPKALRHTIATCMDHLIAHGEEDKPSDFVYTDAIRQHDEGVDFIPANAGLAATEVTLVNSMSRETVLRQYLDVVKQEYDYVLIDCRPSLGLTVINSIAPPITTEVGTEIVLHTAVQAQKEDATASPLAETSLAVVDLPLALKISKVHSKTQKPLSGAGFQLKAEAALSTPLRFTVKDGVYWYDPDGSVTTIEAAGDNCEAFIYGIPAGKYQLEETVVPEHFFPAPPVAVEITLETTSETPREVVVTNTPQVKLGIDADKFNVVIAMALTLIIGSGVGIVALVRHRRKR